MKWVSMLFRETQQEWFGKAGIAWHGAMFIMKYRPDKDSELDLDEFTIVFHDMLSDDKKEDGFAVLSMLHAALHMFIHEQPDVLRGFVETDGAGIATLPCFCSEE
jgi:hypothetical protein